MEFDENDAVKAMQASVATAYDDNELLNIIDMIYDYYESNGLLEIDVDSDDDDDVDPADLVAYVKRMLGKDRGAHVAEADVDPLVRAYLEYESNLY